MATTFTKDGREIKTRFGELALCRLCSLRNKLGVCCSIRYPNWIEGWCQDHQQRPLGALSYLDAKAIAADAYWDGAELEREELEREDQGAESYREPVRDESHD